MSFVGPWRNVIDEYYLLPTSVQETVKSSAAKFLTSPFPSVKAIFGGSPEKSTKKTLTVLSYNSKNKSRGIF